MGSTSAARRAGIARRSKTLRASMLAATLACARLAHAEDVPPFVDLVSGAASAPSQIQSAAELAAAQGRRIQSAAWANPEVEVAVDGFGNDNPRIAEQRETTVSVGQTLPLGGRRRARIAAAQAEVAAAQARLNLSRSDYAAKLAVAYAEAEAAARRTAIAKEGLDAAETDARAAHLLVDSGKEAQLRALQGDTEAERARAEFAAAQAAETTAFARLTALIGVERPYDHIVASLLDAPVNPPAARSVAEPPAAVDAARADRAAAEARVRAARAEVFPEVRVSAGVRRYDNLGGSAVVAGVSLPLPLFDRNRGGVAAAQAELRGAEAKLRQTELDLTADRRGAAANLQSAEVGLAAALTGEKAAAEAYRLARIGYRAGRLPLLELTAARRSLVEAQGRTVDARLARVRAEAELARLDGRIPFGS